MTGWQIEYSREVKNYFWDNGNLVKHLYAAIRSMIENDGFPFSDYEELERIEIRFKAHGHAVIYERWDSQRMVRITQIIPGPDV